MGAISPIDYTLVHLERSLTRALTSLYRMLGKARPLLYPFKPSSPNLRQKMLTDFHALHSPGARSPVTLTYPSSRLHRPEDLTIPGRLVRCRLPACSNRNTECSHEYCRPPGCRICCVCCAGYRAEQYNECEDDRAPCFWSYVSQSLKQVLDYLLELPEPPIAIRQQVKSWLRTLFTVGVFQMDSVPWGVGMSNIYVIEKLIDDKRYQGDYRDLSVVALPAAVSWKSAHRTR